MSIHKNIISNFYSFFEYLSTNSTSELKIRTDFSSVITPNSSWPNFTFDIKLDDTKAKTQLDNIITSIKNNESPNYIIFDDDQVNQHEQLLIELGYIPLAEWACLTYDEEEPVNSEHSELEIRKVNTEEELKQWIEIARTGFGKLDFTLFQKCFKNKELIFYSGYYQAKLVATAMLFFDNKTAGIYHVVTLPQFRKKGFGFQIFSHCQKEALQNGAKEIIAQSTQEGLKTWENTGMRQYGNFYLFCWNKPK